MQSVRVVPADDDDDDQATEMNNTFTGLCGRFCRVRCFPCPCMLGFCQLHHAFVTMGSSLPMLPPACQEGKTLSLCIACCNCHVLATVS